MSAKTDFGGESSVRWAKLLSMSPRLAFALEAAFVASRSTLAHFQVGAAVDMKNDLTPVTVADRNAERMIRELIEKAYPGELILGEEEGGQSNVPDRWVIDPIDGTKSFIAGVPLYSTLLSYEQDGQPILGVIVFPALNELLYAEVGTGSFFNGRPCHVSTKETVKGAILSCGGIKSMVEKGRWNGFSELSERALTTRSWCDAYGHALVATGRIDSMIDPVVSRWDLSAAAIVMKEAGGRFTDFKGNDPFAKGDHDLEAISSNAAIHQEVLNAFA